MIDTVDVIELPEYDSYKYVSVWLITKYRDGCIYETKFIGNAKREDVSNDTIFSNICHVTISSLTPEHGIELIKKHPDNKFVPKHELWLYYKFKPITRNEIIKIVKEFLEKEE